jgi:hypothetical protein
MHAEERIRDFVGMIGQLEDAANGVSEAVHVRTGELASLTRIIKKQSGVIADEIQCIPEHQRDIPR